MADIDLLQETGGFIDIQWPPLVRILQGLVAGASGDFVLNDGTAALPSLRFLNDTNTGLFRPAGADANQFGISAGGTERLRISATGLEIIDASSRLTLPAGAVTNPSLRFSAETNLGIYRPGVGQLSVVQGNADRLIISSAGVGIGVDGSVATPSLSWLSDPDTGFFRAPFQINIEIDGGLNGGPQARFISDSGAGQFGLVLDFATGIGSGPATGDFFDGLTVDLDASSFVRSRMGFLCPQFDGATQFGYFFDTATLAAPTGLESPSIGVFGFLVSGITGFQMDGIVGTQRFRWFNAVGTEIARLNASGNMSIGNVAPTQRLHINGGNIRVQSGVIRNADGTAAAPSYTWETDQGTGMYFIAADIIGFGTAPTGGGASTERVRMDASGIKVSGRGYQSLSANAAVTGSTTLDFRASNVFRLVLTGNATLENPSNLPAAGETAVYTIIIRQDGTGSRTLAFGTKWLFPGGGDPTVTAAANSVDVISCVYDPTSDVLLANIMQDVKA